MDLRALELFVAVVEEGSIHAGARRLMLTQPTVSHAIQKLERDVGGQLLLRTPRGIQLAPAGVVLYDQGREILSRMDLLSTTVSHIARTGNGLLRVGLMAGSASAGELTLPIVTAFRRRYPQVRLSFTELCFADQFSAIVEGRVDVAIVRPPCGDERLTTSPLFFEPTEVCFSAQHRLAKADAVSLDDVLDEPMIELVRAPGRWREYWELNEFRGGPPRRTHAAPAITLSELQYAVLCEPAVGPATSIAWRYGLSSPLLRAMPILDAPPNEVAVAHLRTPTRAWVPQFVSCAREVSAELFNLVPGVRPGEFSQWKHLPRQVR